MTFKDIAEVAGCSYRTTRTYAKKIWPERTFTGKLGDGLNEEDSRKLMEALPKRNMVASGKSAADQVANLPVGTGQMSTHDMMRAMLSMIPSIVAETIKQVMPAMQMAKPEQNALPFIPEIPVRKQIANVVNNWAVKNGGRKFDDAYHKLYKNFGDRYGIDVEERAKNRGIKPVEYLEREGKLEELYMCAVQLFGGAA